MARVIKRLSKTAGLMPGTLVHVGEERTAKTRITIIDYDEENFSEQEIKSVEECLPFREKNTVTWINLDGVHEMDVIEKAGKCFKLHPLILEDIVNTAQRPKMEEFEEYIFIVIKMIYTDDKNDEIVSEQVSLALGENFVISFQEQEGDVFGVIRDRIRTGKGRLRKMGADYLAYAILDSIVDNYYIILEKYGEELESMEEILAVDPDPENLREIHKFKREAIFLRKSIWPLREVTSALVRGESRFIKPSTGIYLRDVYDHTVQVIDTVENFRDMVSGMMDIYLSSISNKMNEIMKVLTIIATIFIPITFVAGVYGMNFNPEVSRFNMPELNWPFGYLFAWAVMIAIAGSMIAYFKRKKWL
ncbi:MAG: magnesium/cobalt transporter CorA [Candidatus Omnitrophota bacterium]